MSNPLRNSNINYSDGWFFVTMQVAQNKTMFGVIADDKCELNALGEKVGSSWEGMFARHPEAYRDASVVMPNHFHAVIRIHRRPTNKPNHLSYLIQGFKSFTTHLYHAAVRAGQCPDIGTSLWMSSYYDNLITSRRELENIRAYVRDNPARWDNDRFGPVTTYHCGNLELLHEALVAYVASRGRTRRSGPTIRTLDIVRLDLRVQPSVSSTCYFYLYQPAGARCAGALPGCAPPLHTRHARRHTGAVAACCRARLCGGLGAGALALGTRHRYQQTTRHLVQPLCAGSRRAYHARLHPPRRHTRNPAKNPHPTLATPLS